MSRVFLKISRVPLLIALLAVVVAVTAHAKSEPPTVDPHKSSAVPLKTRNVADQALFEWCNAVTLVIPQIKRKPCIAAGLNPVVTRSVQGRPLMVRDVPAKQITVGTKPIKVLLLGGIHGDELTSPAIVFRWLERLNQPDAATYHWRAVPVLNPDGLLAKPPTRVNANAVDLNRNFPTPGWEKEAPKYWEKVTKSDPRRYPGPSALSEPESRWLHSEMTAFAPDVIVSVHAPYGVLDFDGPAPGNKGTVVAPARFGRLVLTRVGVYPGSLGNFGGKHVGVPVVTLELPHALNLPTEAELDHIWNDMLSWIQRNVAKDTPPATPPNS